MHFDDASAGSPAGARPIAASQPPGALWAARKKAPEERGSVPPLPLTLTLAPASLPQRLKQKETPRSRCAGYKLLPQLENSFEPDGAWCRGIGGTPFGSGPLPDITFKVTLRFIAGERETRALLHLPRRFHTRASLVPNSSDHNSFVGEVGCKGGKGPISKHTIR